MRKEKWIVFSKTLEFINAFDPQYDPLKDKKYWGVKMQTLMNNFVVIIQTMNEKKAMYVETYPNKAAKVQRRIRRKNVVAPSQYTLLRRVGYVMIQNVQQTPLHQKPRS